MSSRDDRVLDRGFSGGFRKLHGSFREGFGGFHGQPKNRNSNPEPKGQHPNKAFTHRAQPET